MSDLVERLRAPQLPIPVVVDEITLVPVELLKEAATALEALRRERARIAEDRATENVLAEGHIARAQARIAELEGALEKKSSRSRAIWRAAANVVDDWAHEREKTGDDEGAEWMRDCAKDIRARAALKEKGNV